MKCLAVFFVKSKKKCYAFLSFAEQILDDEVNRFALRVKVSADDILKYCSYFFQKMGFDISCKLSPLETICMKCQILFSGKI